MFPQVEMQKILATPFDRVATAVQNTSCCDVLEFMPQLYTAKGCSCVWSFSYDSKIFRWQEQGHECEINLHTAVLAVEKNAWQALTSYNLVIFRCCRKIFLSVKVLKMVEAQTLATLFRSGFKGAFL